MSSVYTIRPTRPEELDIVMPLFDQARATMRRSGNWLQWADGYPDRAAIARDIALGQSYVCVVDNHGQSPGLDADIQMHGLPSDVHSLGLPVDIQSPGLPYDDQTPGLPYDDQSPVLPAEVRAPLSVDEQPSGPAPYDHALGSDGGWIVGTFALVMGAEPTYKQIYRGAWLDDRLPYATVHRLAAATGIHGLAAACFGWCACRAPSLRVDTHRDNAIMRHLLPRLGFTYCGIIYLQNGDERLAYQKLTGH